MRISLIFLSLACTFQAHSAVTQLNALSYARADGSNQNANMQRAVNAAVASGYRLYVPPGIVYNWNLLTNTENLFIDDDTLPGQATYYGALEIRGRPSDTNEFPNLYIKDGKLSVEGMFISINDTGADPTAAQDSRNAIQAAFNAAGPNGSVYVPDGDFKVVVTLPIKGNIKKLYGTGRIWWSLPDDYTNPNTYGVNDSYTTTGVLDRNGALVAWDSSDPSGNPGVGYYGTTPWNGKGAMFQDIGNLTNNTVIEGITFNGGWGTVNPPGTVRPITGVRASINENVYYTIFANCSLALIKGCTFENIAGTTISHGFGDLTITQNNFREYGDHHVYNTDQGTIRIIDNTFLVNRAAVSAEGSADFVAQVYRDAIKLRNMTNCVIQGNIFRDDNTTRRAQFITLEANSSNSDWGTNGTRNITITGNNVKAFVGIIGAGFRSTAVSDGAGLRCRNILVSGNTWDITANVLQLIDFACDGFVFSENEVNLNSSILAQVFGSQLYTDAIKNLSINRNYCISSNLTQAPFLLGGSINSMFVRGNTFIEQNPEHTTGLNLINTISNASLERNRRVSELDMIDIQNNVLVNYYSFFSDLGHTAWDTTVTYPYSSTALDDGTYVINNVVLDAVDGLAYTNNAVVLSSTRPGLDPTNWGLFQPQESQVHIVGNDRTSNSSLVGGLGATKLANIAASKLKYNYKANYVNNLHRTSIAQPVAYRFDPGIDASSVSRSWTNLQQSVDQLYVNWRLGVGQTNPVAPLHVIGGIKSDAPNSSSNTVDLYVGSVHPQSGLTVSDREFRHQVQSDGSSFIHWLLYGGRVSGDLNAPSFTRGNYGKMSGIQFHQFGWLDFWMTTNDFGSGTNESVSLFRTFRIAPSATTNDTPYIASWVPFTNYHNYHGSNVFATSVAITNYLTASDAIITNFFKIGTTAATNVFGNRILFEAAAGSPRNSVFIATSDLAQGTAGTILALGVGAATGNTYGEIRAIDQGGNSGANLALQVGSENLGVGTNAPVAKFEVVHSLKADNDTTGGNTRLLLWDVTAGTFQRVTIGAADSGGVGFRVLRIPN